MQIKLIATDLDSTLMMPDHMTVSQRTKKALKATHDSGVKISIATGRTIKLINNVIEQIPFVDYVIYSNGASVYDIQAQRNIYENHISVNDTAEIIATLRNMKLYYNVYSHGNIFIQTGKDKYYKNPGLPEDFLRKFTLLSKICDVGDEIKGNKAEIIAIYSMTDIDRRFLESKFNKMHLFVTSSIPDEIEVTANKVNKGNALKGLCDEIGITHKNVMAFGDAMNDAPMLEFSDFSFAMGNAVDELKHIAKFVTKTNAEDGVAVALEKYIL